MTTYNTGNPIGSTDARDRSDNSEFLDEVVNSFDLTKPDRFGRIRDTLEGVYQKSAYYRVGTFDAGYTLTNNRQTLAYGNVEYSWSGAFPKVVPAGSTPATTGGVVAGAWVDRTQDTLASDLNSTSGAEMVKSSDGMSVQEKVDVYDKEISHRKMSSVYSLDYTFNADGVTDDSANFASLEIAVSAKIVDLLGKTYKVNSVPNKNRYINGRFIVPFSYQSNGSTLSGTYFVNAVDSDTSSPITVVERDLRTPMARIAYQPIQTSGLQGLCFDEPNRYLYSMYFDSSSGSEKTVINRYSMEALDVYPDTVTPDLTTLATTVVGHQGLSLEYVTNNDPKLWSAVRYDATNYPLGHRQVARFNVANAADVSNLQLYTLFGSEFSYTGNSTMVAVSYDQRWLVAVGRKASRDFWVRVFDLNMLVAGGAGDYSKSYAHEFNIDPSILSDDGGGAYTPIQNIACDGGFIYVLAGNATQQGKKIWQYSINGCLVGQNSTVSVGLSQSQSDGSFYEPEAIAFYKAKGQAAPSMALLINTSGKKNYIYQCGGEAIGIDDSWTPTATAVTNVSSVTVSSAMYHLQNGFAMLAGRVVVTSPATGSLTFRLSLPFGHIDTSLTQAQGTFESSANAGGRIQLDTATGTLDFTGVANSTASVAYSFNCMMRVIN